MASVNNTSDIPDHAVNTAVNNEPKRKVSILTDPPHIQSGGYDNPAFDGPRRKISQQQALQQAHEPITQQPTPANYDKHNGDFHLQPHRRPQRKHSATESLYSRHSHKSPKRIEPENQLEHSWIYALCMRCRVQYSTPSWQPKGWEKVCPYPLCPSYRQFARLVSITLIGVLIYATLYAIIGKSAAPGGQLFSLIVLTIAANFGGWLFGLTTMPRLIGMLLTGIIMQNIGAVNIDGIDKVTAHLRKFALVIILTRAGLEMDPEAFKKVWPTIIKLSLIPWVVEAAANAIISHFLFDMPWMWCFLLGAIIAAVSPAVVVPCLFRLRTKGYGVAKGIPTLIVAVAGICDAISVALFGIISSLMFATGGLSFQISQAPVCIFGGLGFGIIWGWMARVIPEKGDAYVVPIRTLMLLCGGLVAVYGSELLHYEGAGPLGVVFAAFTSQYFWIKQGWTLEDSPVGTAFEIFWMIFEPILFGITGATVKINELDPNVVSYGLISLVAGGIIRIITTTLVSFGDRLNWKERVFVSLSWMAKATVQAALGPIALKHLSADDPDVPYASIVLMLCILSIVVTAPTGAILISITGTKLLTKTKNIHMPEVPTWRRPSIRSIAIEEEEEDDEDDEERRDPTMGPDKNTLHNTFANAQNSINPIPPFTITKM
ncbi:sodium/hydrogen exchanger 9B2 isoform X2 [Chironomus tepperi]|uniref:sodium/hydrogen exchanger 9B2 isoform X2 n=1 Tax=Chironomus tepperi TaxID=113505 RepID=UPI00391F2D27